LSRRLKGDPVTDPKFQHVGERPHLVEPAEARDDPVVEVDQLGLGQPVDIDLRGSPFSRLEGASRAGLSPSRPFLSRRLLEPFGAACRQRAAERNRHGC
jgi:hypothetical protein